LHHPASILPRRTRLQRLLATSTELTFSNLANFFIPEARYVRQSSGRPLDAPDNLCVSVAGLEAFASCFLDFALLLALAQPFEES
jgi:hypothetical protein